MNYSMGFSCIYGRLEHNLERGFEERLRKRMQLVFVGWCIVHTVWQQRQLRIVQLKYIIAAAYFADIFASCCVLSHCSRLEVFNKVMGSLGPCWVRPPNKRNFL
jgi:hypothetical protein